MRLHGYHDELGGVSVTEHDWIRRHDLEIRQPKYPRFQCSHCQQGLVITNGKEPAAVLANRPPCPGKAPYLSDANPAAVARAAYCEDECEDDSPRCWINQSVRTCENTIRLLEHVQLQDKQCPGGHW